MIYQIIWMEPIRHPMGISIWRIVDTMEISEEDWNNPKSLQSGKLNLKQQWFQQNPRGYGYAQSYIIEKPVSIVAAKPVTSAYENMINDSDLSDFKKNLQYVEYIEQLAKELRKTIEGMAGMAGL